jgi:hypothetical protein
MLDNLIQEQQVPRTSHNTRLLKIVNAIRCESSYFEYAFCADIDTEVQIFVET